METKTDRNMDYNMRGKLLNIQRHRIGTNDMVRITLDMPKLDWAILKLMIDNKPIRIFDAKEVEKEILLLPEPSGWSLERKLDNEH